MFRKDDCFEAGIAVVYADIGRLARDGALEDVEVGVRRMLDRGNTGGGSGSIFQRRDGMHFALFRYSSSIPRPFEASLEGILMFRIVLTPAGLPTLLKVFYRCNMVWPSSENWLF